MNYKLSNELFHKGLIGTCQFDFFDKIFKGQLPENVVGESEDLTIKLKDADVKIKLSSDNVNMFFDKKNVEENAVMKSFLTLEAKDDWQELSSCLQVYVQTERGYYIIEGTKFYGTNQADLILKYYDSEVVEYSKSRLGNEIPNSTDLQSIGISANDIYASNCKIDDIYDVFNCSITNSPKEYIESMEKKIIYKDKKVGHK